MTAPNIPQWLDWSSRLQAIAQNGLTFARDPYDMERYQGIRQIAAEMLAAGSDIGLPMIRSLLDKDSGYATPKVDVRGVAFHNHKLLLVKEKSDGGWTLPGGWADIGESPAENVVREVYEESGFRTRPSKILAVFDRSKHPHQPLFPFHVYKLFIRCEIIGGSPTPSSETEDVKFFAECDFPELSVSRVTSWQLHRLFEHYRNPNLPTDFDPVT